MRENNFRPAKGQVALLDDNGSGTVTPRLVRYENGAKQAVEGSGSSFSLTDNTTYTLKCVIGNDPGNSALQQLELFVGGTSRLTSTRVDDVWSAGKVGLFRTTNPASTTTLQWDAFKCGKDNNADGDVDDASMVGRPSASPAEAG